MLKGLGSAVHLAHLLLSEALGPGGTAIDATAGNGCDTLFLARQVGPQGKVYAIDIQAGALAKTSLLLQKAGVLDRVILLHSSHEEMEQLVTAPVDAVIFNLGYLPGGDHNLVTTSETTARALRAALKMLKPEGRIGLVIYTGHPGGQEELAVVEGVASSLDVSLYRVVRLNFINRSAQAPVVIVIEKAGVGDENQPAAQNP
ncbi:MAG: class I SAM-dependent methyltransferase [Desulfotomaculaceae bacterium]|nr:class I SAM-dependent methyltransferase [Desulfotomaculaceae bacterium]